MTGGGGGGDEVWGVGEWDDVRVCPYKVQPMMQKPSRKQGGGGKGRWRVGRELDYTQTLIVQ